MLKSNALFRLFRMATIVAVFLVLSATAFGQTKLLRFPDIHGDRLAFTYGGDIWTASASGGSAIRLTAHPGIEVFAKFSPDGKWIAFTSLTGGFQIYIVRTGGGEAIGPLAAGEDPSWAPNSRALMFCTGRDHGKSLSLLDVPTKQVKTLARIQESNSQPSWAK